MADIMWSWNKRQREIILFYRKHRENRKAIELAAKNFDVGERNIYKMIEKGKYHLLKAVEDAIKDLLKKGSKVIAWNLSRKLLSKISNTKT